MEAMKYINPESPFSESGLASREHYHNAILSRLLYEGDDKSIEDYLDFMESKGIEIMWEEHEKVIKGWFSK